MSTLTGGPAETDGASGALPGGALTPDARWRRVAVLGVGLIGGSFAASLRARGLADRIVGFGPQAPTEQARALGLIDVACERIADAVGEADLVMLAAPIPALPALLAELAAHLRPDAIVSDCASTKQSVIAAARAHLGAGAARFVAGHPIAGSERSGPAAARAGLFDGAQVMICPQPDTDPRALLRVEATWRALGAHLVRIDAPAHDALYAELSHWPHVVGFALSAAVACGDHAQDALRFAGGGLRDTTRIGASAPELWADILLDNRDAVLRSGAAYQAQLDAIRNALERRDRDALVERLRTGSDWRRRLT